MAETQSPVGTPRDSRSDAARAQDGAWARFVTDEVRGGGVPFPSQLDAWRRIFSDRAPSDGPPRAWAPTRPAASPRGGPDPGSGSNLARWLADHGLHDHDELHVRSITDRSAFWTDAVDRLGIRFGRGPGRALAASYDPLNPGWFGDATLDIVDSCFSGRAESLAVVSRSEGETALRTTTRGALDLLVSGVAAGLRSVGFEPGDRIALCMPMTLECVAAYLGIIRAGCCVVSIADSFSAEEIAKRLEIAECCGIVTVDVFRRAGKPIGLYDRVKRADGPRAIVVDASSELREGDLAWDVLLARGAPLLDATGRYPSAPGSPRREITVLFSSGTTGTPKAIAWNHLTPVKAVLDGHVYQDIRPGDVVCWPTNIGWMMGPWLIFAGLVNGATIALFEGAPTGAGFTSFVRDAGVTVLGVVPALVRAWRAGAESSEAHWPDVRVFSTTGEPSNPEDYLWLMSRAAYRAPVIEYIGGTELGGAYMAGTVEHAASPGTFNAVALGLEVSIRTDFGAEAAEGESGELFLVPPAIGLSEYLLNGDHESVYHEGCPRSDSGIVMRRHGDRISRLGQGFFRADGRADDTMNLGGIKVGSLELERVLSRVTGVRDCAAIGVQPRAGGGARLVVYVIPRDGAVARVLAEDMTRELAERMNPLFRVHDVVLVESFPRTASNKLIRRELEKLYRAERA